MHEWSIVASLIDRAESEAKVRGATRVVRLEVAIGELAGVEVDLLRTAYETFRDRTLCAGAPLTVERIAAVWSCPSCAADLTAQRWRRCAACSRPARLAAGGEITLQRIELEVA